MNSAMMTCDACRQSTSGHCALHPVVFQLGHGAPIGLSDDDIERIAEAVVRKLREQARRQGRPVAI